MARPAGRPTSRDVARLAGVSQTTVSLVINEVPTVSITEETRSRVRSAVVQLDYHPHEGARSLSRKATRTIGVAIPDAGNPHYMEITEAIEAYAEARGYSIVLIVTNYDLACERRCLRWLKQQRVDALIPARRSSRRSTRPASKATRSPPSWRTCKRRAVSVSGRCSNIW